LYRHISYINMCRLNKNREWRKEWEREVSGDVCDCCFGELPDNKKLFWPLYIFKHVLDYFNPASMFCFFFELRFVPSKYSLRAVLSLWCQSRRLLSFLYSNTCLKIISLCSYESVGLPQVKCVRSKTGSQLRFWNNVCLIFE
jgi:hypothetical protein